MPTGTIAITVTIIAGSSFRLHFCQKKNPLKNAPRKRPAAGKVKPIVPWLHHGQKGGSEWRILQQTAAPAQIQTQPHLKSIPHRGVIKIADIAAATAISQKTFCQLLCTVVNRVAATQGAPRNERSHVESTLVNANKKGDRASKLVARRTSV